MSGPIDYVRLGFAVDSSGLDRAGVAIDATAGKAVRLGGIADTASISLNELGVSGAAAAKGIGSADAAAVKTSADFLAFARSLAGANANLEQLMNATNRWLIQQKGAGYSAATAIKDRTTLKSALDAEAIAMSNSGKAAEAAAAKFSFLGGAAGSLAGIFAFQLLSSVISVVSEIARIPVEAAHAQDALLRFSTQLTYAFHGSSEAAKQARQDIIALARDTGLPLDDLQGQYGGLATAGRAAGLTRPQVSGLTSTFARLGMLTGADAGQIGRAEWQLQQALSIGRLNSMDFRQMRSNLPGLNDVLASGMSDVMHRPIDAGRLQGMVSRGEVSSDRLVQALIAGMDKLQQTAGGLPQTLETASARIQTEWTLMLQNLGNAIQASPVMQAVLNGVAGNIREFNTRSFGSASEQLNYARADLRDAMANPNDPMSGAAAESARQRIRQLQAQADAERIMAAGHAQAQAAADLRTTQERYRTNARNTAEDMNPLLQARAQITGQIDTLGKAIGVGGSAEDVRAWGNALGILRGQLAALGTSAQKAARDLVNANADFAAYGPGGFAAAQAARSMRERALAESAPIGQSQALDAVLGQALLQARIQTGQGQADLDLQRSTLGSSLAGGPAAQRRAQLEYQLAQFRAGFGPAANDNRVNGAVADRRALLTGQQAFSDAQANGQRTYTDEERLRNIREQLALSVRLGDAGATQLAQLERQQQLRAAGVTLTQAEMRAEMDRVAALQEASKQLSDQQEMIATLNDAVHAAASFLTNEFSAAWHQVIENGHVSAKTLQQIFAQTAAQIGEDIAKALVLDPIEHGVEDWAAALLKRLPTKDGASAGGNFLSNLASNVVNAVMGGSKHAYGDVFGATHYAAGGILSRPTYFAYGGQTGLAGEAGAEAILPLKRGSDGKLGVAANDSGAANVHVEVNDMRSMASSAPVDVQTSVDANGARRIRMIIRDTTKADMKAGRYNDTMRDQFGTEPALRQV